MASGLAGKVRRATESDEFDLSGYDQARCTELAKAAFSEAFPLKEMVRISFVVGGGKLVRQKYSDDLPKFMVNALSSVGFQEDRDRQQETATGASQELNFFMPMAMALIYVITSLLAFLVAGQSGVDLSSLSGSWQCTTALPSWMTSCGLSFWTKCASDVSSGGVSTPGKANFMWSADPMDTCTLPSSCQESSGYEFWCCGINEADCLTLNTGVLAGIAIANLLWWICCILLCCWCCGCCCFEKKTQVMYVQSPASQPTQGMVVNVQQQQQQAFVQPQQPMTDNSATVEAGSAGKFKYHHDTNKNLKFVHVFPRIHVEAAPAAYDGEEGEEEAPVVRTPEQLLLECVGRLGASRCRFATYLTT
eukprot:symbB.v1.2.024560.t1/scaffold2334.1/size145401/2